VHLMVGDMFVLEYEWGGDVGMGRCGGDWDWLCGCVGMMEGVCGCITRVLVWRC